MKKKWRGLLILILTLVIISTSANIVGAATDPHDLSNYAYRTVVTGGKGALVFQKSPGGSFMYDYEFWDGDQIYVNTVWRENGYALAYQNGTYGFVDASYINWYSGGSNSSSTYDNPRDLSYFGYRTVNTNGKGTLVFQTSPKGSFMYDYQFNTGDSIYVNLNWRESGYALAYQNGVYGYVDASYINWSSGGSNSSSTYDDSKDLSYFGYRTVNTNGKGALVFQTSPKGSFMNNYRFNTGDSIYVNLNWRKSGYAIAYENGVYGYVDASYINW